MKKAFDGQGREIGSRELDEILATVLDNLSVTVPLTVERVQDEVERTLMERGHYEVAKAYILYREKRSAPVSYTHLRCLRGLMRLSDLLKLRNLLLEFLVAHFFDFFGDNAAVIFIMLFHIAPSVSYTHLDVYKRQSPS